MMIVKKNNGMTRLLACLMALVLLAGLLPVTALAASESTTVSTAADETETNDTTSLREAVEAAQTGGGDVAFAAAMKGKTLSCAEPLNVTGHVTIVLTGQTITASFTVAEGAVLKITGEGHITAPAGSAAIVSSGTVEVDLNGSISGETAVRLTKDGAALHVVHGTFTGAMDLGNAAFPSIVKGQVCEFKDGESWVAYSDQTPGKDVTFRVRETTPPQITAGNATRDTAAEASVPFESDEAGTYYYEVVSQGAEAPSVSADSTSATMTQGKNTIAVTGLGDGAFTLYLKARDTRDNMTADADVITVDIPAYVLKDFSVTLPTGEHFTAAGDASVKEGQSYTFTVEFEEGYTGVVQNHGQALTAGENNAYTIANVDKQPDITVTDVKKNTYTITVEGTGFTLDPAVTTVEHGGSYSFTVKPAVGYKIDTGTLVVKAGEETLPYVDGKYTVSNIKADQTITVTGVEKSHYTVTLPTGDGYTAAAEGGATTVDHGEDYVFTVTLAQGYVKSSDFAVKAGDTTLTESGGKYTIPAVTANQTVTVTGVVKATYEIVYATSTAYDLVAISGTPPIAHGGSYSFVVNLKPGYSKGSDFAVKANGTVLTPGSDNIYTIYDISSPQKIDIVGVTNAAYNVTFSSDVSYTVAAANSSKTPVAYNGTYSFTVTPKPGYVRGSNFSVKTNGSALAPDANGVYTIYNITGDQNVVISGVVSASSTLTYSVTLTGGTGYSFTAQNGSTSPVTPGGSYSFKVNVASGYTRGTNFAVKVNGNTITANTNGVYTISNINANQTVTVTGVTKTTTSAGGGGTVPAAAPSVTTTSLPNGAMGTAYSQKLTANGANITWSYTGTLPNGLSLNAATGEISGTPTLNGTFRFAVKATNTVGSNTKQLTITITGTEYKISEGQKAEWTQGSQEGLTFKTDSEAAYVKVQVDGKDVAARYVTTADNGSSVTLKPEYLEDLDNGTHTITIVYGDGSGKTTFSVAAEDNTVPPSIALQPEAQTAASGDKVTFAVSAGGTTPLICQWQVDKNDGSGWQNITGAVNASYTITADGVQNGYKFRCVVTNGAGSVTSDEASLTITDAESAGEDGGTGDEQETGKKKSGVWIWIVVGVVVLAGIAAAAVILYRRKKDYYGD